MVEGQRHAYSVQDDFCVFPNMIWLDCPIFSWKSLEIDINSCTLVSAILIRFRQPAPWRWFESRHGLRRPRWASQSRRSSQLTLQKPLLPCGSPKMDGKVVTTRYHVAEKYDLKYVLSLISLGNRFMNSGEPWPYLSLSCTPTTVPDSHSADCRAPGISVARTRKTYQPMPFRHRLLYSILRFAFYKFCVFYKESIAAKGKTQTGASSKQSQNRSYMEHINSKRPSWHDFLPSTFGTKTGSTAKQHQSWRQWTRRSSPGGLPPPKSQNLPASEGQPSCGKWAPRGENHLQVWWCKPNQKKGSKQWRDSVTDVRVFSGCRVVFVCVFAICSKKYKHT